MCAIIGIQSRSFDLSLLERLLIESSVRGLHATGVAFQTDDGTIQVLKEPIGAEDFLRKYPASTFLRGDGSLNLIAHCRYSTSDLEWNQPFLRADGSLALVHNGVVSQAEPEQWGVKTESRNDSELLLHFDQPLKQFPEASIAACTLSADGILSAFRNGKRPAYYAEVEGGVVVASTSDILHRCSLYPYRMGAGAMLTAKDGNYLLRQVENFKECIPCTTKRTSSMA